MKYRIPRSKSLAMFGPTKGDRLRLGDTELIIEIEEDLTVIGDQVKFGGGKVIRDGMGQSSTKLRSPIHGQGSPDTVITNVIVIDYSGIYKADVGLRDGKISCIGAAGNPGIMDGVHPGLVIGASTEIIAGEGLILTAGGIDSHIHFISPTQSETALNSGITTMLGGGTGPATGTLATTCTPGAWHLEKMFKSLSEWSLNFGLLGKGNASTHEPLREQIRAGACGLKLHEDWGTTPAAIDTCLDIAEEMSVQVAIHTDTLNESGYVESTIDAFKGRTIHTYHSEGAGGGHAPDIIKVCGLPNVLPSSTNPTRPFTRNTLPEHRDMLMVCHHLDPSIPEDIAFADSRIRPQTIAAEDMLHDMGAISMMSSDSQAMGRVGEVIMRTFQTAHKMKVQFGALKEDSARNDNFRIKRYISKFTINPAIAHGLEPYIGSIEPGKFADLCLWRPEFFGVHPEMVIKNGSIVWAQMGDANASIPTPGPIWGRRMFGSYGQARTENGILFTSKIAYESGVFDSISKPALPIMGTRNLGKKDMKYNDALPHIEVNPETYEVRADGKLLHCDPIDSLPLAQRYFIF